MIQSNGGNLGGGAKTSKAGQIGMAVGTGNPIAMASALNPKVGQVAGIAGAMGGGSSPGGGNTTMPDGSVAGPSNNYGAPQLQIPQNDPMGAINRRMGPNG